MSASGFGRLSAPDGSRPVPARGRTSALAGSLLILVGLAAGLVSDGTPASAVALTSNWIELSPASPPPRTAAAMAYDPATGDTVLFGGDNIVGGSSNLLADTWVWNGATWTEEFPAVSPPARDGASLAYDSVNGDLVLFGGLSADGDMGDTWIWNGITWSEPKLTKSPPARYAASMADDPTAGTVVLYGGLANRTALSDTWTWNGAAWTQQSPASRPSPRDDAAMAYDAHSGDVVLFGGSTASGPLSDTWIWNGSTWTSRTPAQSPPGRFGASIAYDPDTTSVVLFGGYSGGQSDLADMWTWNGTIWSEIIPATSPPARRFAGMVYDPDDGSITLFGGDPGGVTPSSLGDTWIWGSEGTFTAAVSSPTIVVNGQEAVTATLTGKVGAGPPTGAVSFFVCGPDAAPTPCTSQATSVGSPVDLTAGTGATATATSTTFQPQSPGYWCFAESYAGDTNYAPATDTTDGCFLVDPAIGLVPNQSRVTASSSDGAVATVFGNSTDGAPTGIVTFYLCTPTSLSSGCISPDNQIDAPVALTAGSGDNATAASPDTGPLTTGIWCIAAEYSGDTNYSEAPDTTTDGCITVSPNLSDAVALPSVHLGATDTDVAAVTGNAGTGVPTGTVSFFACGPTASPIACTGETDPVGSPVTLSLTTGAGAQAVSPAFLAPSAGEWCFEAVYSGDGNYGPETDSGTGQCFDVTAVAAAFTSPATATGTAKQPFTFTVITTGNPAPTISSTDLPSWLVLTGQGNGKATLSATKARKGKHRFELTATNSAGSVTQIFLLTVSKAAT